MRTLFLILLLAGAKCFAQPGPPRTPVLEATERMHAQRPGLQQVKVDSVASGNVWVRITGRVMLNGDCSSAMPMFGVEMRNDTGWEERTPVDQGQMDCGLPWADWTDQPFMIALPAGLRTNSREGEGELTPGNYRLVFMGADRERMPTGPFRVD